MPAEVFDRALSDRDSDREALRVRAEIARLTLELRSVRQQIASAELALAECDPERQRLRMRARLDRLADRRQVALDEELRTARGRADAAVASPRSELRAAQPSEQLGDPLPIETFQADLEHVDSLADVVAWADEVASSIADAPTQASTESIAGELSQANPESVSVADKLTADVPVADELTDDMSVVEAPVVEAPGADELAANTLVVEALAETSAEETVTVPITTAPSLSEVEAVIGGLGSIDGSWARLEEIEGALADLPVDPDTEILVSITDLQDALAPADVAAPGWQDRPGGSPIVVTLDAEAFSKAFAAMFTAMLDERLAAGASLPVYSHPAQTQPVYPHYVNLAAPAPKRSFWSNVWHADVVLSVLAMSIVLIVLIAWSS